MAFLGGSRNWTGEAFGRFELRDRLADQSRKMRDAIERYDADDLLSESVEGLVDKFVDEYGLSAPQIRWAEAEQSEAVVTTVEVARDFRYAGY